MLHCTENDASDDEAKLLSCAPCSTLPDLLLKHSLVVSYKETTMGRGWMCHPHNRQRLI